MFPPRVPLQVEWVPEWLVVVGSCDLDLLAAAELAGLAESEASPLVAWSRSRRLVSSVDAGRPVLLRGRRQRELLGWVLVVEEHWRRGFLVARIGRGSLGRSGFFHRTSVCFDLESQNLFP